MHATALLEQQHRKVEALLPQLEGKRRAEAQGLLRELADVLAAHMALEQELFYPAVRGVDRVLVAQGFEEHAMAEVALKRLLTCADEVSFAARLNALKELIQQHVMEEEHELFPKVHVAMAPERLLSLGEDMQRRFERLIELGFDQLVPKGLLTTSADVAQYAQRHVQSATRRRIWAPRPSASFRRPAAGFREARLAGAH